MATTIRLDDNAVAAAVEALTDALGSDNVLTSAMRAVNATRTTTRGPTATRDRRS
jgi:hypothetical protein